MHVNMGGTAGAYIFRLGTGNIAENQVSKIIPIRVAVSCLQLYCKCNLRQVGLLLVLRLGRHGSVCAAKVAGVFVKVGGRRLSLSYPGEVEKVEKTGGEKVAKEVRSSAMWFGRENLMGERFSKKRVCRWKERGC